MIDPEILRQVRRIEVRSRRLVTDVMAGGYASAFRGAGIEFEEVREYVDGDDPRSVDWNVTARTGRPHVKKFVEERELTVVFLLDLSASTRGGPRRRSAREAAAELVACLALAAVRSHDKVGLVAFTDRVEKYVPPKKGLAHALAIVRDALALEPAGRGTDLEPPLVRAMRALRRRAVVFLVSDFLAPLPRRALASCARRHDLIAARLRFPESSARGLVRLRDLESGAERLLDLSSRAVRHASERSLDDFEDETRLALRRSSADLLDVAIDESVGDPLVDFFRRRETRARRR